MDEIADHLISLDTIQGITFSGGEPMAQAAALSHLVKRIRSQRDLSFMSFTGYTLKHLRSRGTQAQQELLSQLDILVDGPFVTQRRTDLRWRGSDNQIVHLLSARHDAASLKLEERGYQVELEFDENGSPHWMGIPPDGLREIVEVGLKEKGISLENHHV